MIIFITIYRIYPISYNELPSRHSTYLKENLVLVNSSFSSTENDKLKFLEYNS